MGPYTKRNNSTAIDDGWTVEEGDGYVIAHLDTESLTDSLLAVVLGDALPGDGDEVYAEGVPLGEYVCQDCGRLFEYRSGDRKCPSCGDFRTEPLAEDGGGG